MILDEIVEKRKEQLIREAGEISRADIKSMACDALCDYSNIKAKFSDALSGERLGFICEVKKASPSKGLICENFQPLKIAQEYQHAGANAVSCLTEEYYFKGSNEYLKEIAKNINLPVLRKDFIFDDYQIAAAKVMGASAILLIAGILSKSQLADYLDYADSLALECLVEVHDEQELQKVLDTNAQIIGINNRNLKTFEVDLATTGKLARFIPKDKIIVSESGIKNNQDCKAVKALGANAVLVGETLMKSQNIQQTFEQLSDGV